MNPTDDLPEFLAKLHQYAWQSRVQQLKRELLNGVDSAPPTREEVTPHRSHTVSYKGHLRARKSVKVPSSSLSSPS